MLNITTDGFSLIQTEVGESVYFVHMNQELFPHPHLFDPDRYSRARDVGVHLESFLVPFLKGARDCVGKKYVTANMSLALSIHFC
jgi:cytochrome P450